MTPVHLLLAVKEITKPGAPAVATGEAIFRWLKIHNIDPGRAQTRGNRFFEEADHANAPTPLRKFKIQKRSWSAASGKAPCAGSGENGWSLVERWDDACEWTTLQTPVWRATPWCSTCRNWIFECSALVQRGTALSGFDARVLNACSFGPTSHKTHR
jgi:hypothetical protein